jgi:choline dehydrogenase-like flavoprotein
MPSVIVVGGSIGGLTAALVLRDAGCDVRVFERSTAALQARGAGIAVLDATLRTSASAAATGEAGRLLEHQLDPLPARRRQRPARAAAPLPVLVLEHHLPVPARHLRRRTVTSSARESPTSVSRGEPIAE